MVCFDRVSIDVVRTTYYLFLQVDHSKMVIGKLWFEEKCVVTQTLDWEVLCMWKIPEEEDH